jgi:hypothetical protein
MELSAKLTLDRAYFAEAFDQSIRYSNKRYRIERLVGVLFLAFGVVWAVWSNGKLASPFAFLLVGLYALISPFIKKLWWIHRQVKSKAGNWEVALTFTDAGISTSGPYSSGRIEWEGVERILETPKGVLVWPQKGIHIYLPKSTVASDVIEFVVSKGV